jgi:hypothetical protein
MRPLQVCLWWGCCCPFACALFLLRESGVVNKDYDPNLIPNPTETSTDALDTPDTSEALVTAGRMLRL